MGGNFMKPVVIPAGQSLSGSEFSEGYAISGIILPTLWDIANIAFAASLDNVTFNPVFDKNGNEYVLTVAGARHITIPEIDVVSVRWFKVRSGPSSAPVNQTAQRIVYVVFSGST